MEPIIKEIIKNSIIVVKDSIQHKQKECDILFNHIIKQYKIKEQTYTYDLLFDYVYNFPDDNSLENVTDLIIKEQGIKNELESI